MSSLSVRPLLLQKSLIAKHHENHPANMQNKGDKQLRQLNGKRRRQSPAVRKFFK